MNVLPTVISKAYTADVHRRWPAILLLCLCTVWFAATAGVQRASGVVPMTAATAAAAAPGEHAGCCCAGPGSTDNAQTCKMACCQAKHAPAAKGSPDSGSGGGQPDQPEPAGKCGHECGCVPAQVVDVSPGERHVFSTGLAGVAPAVFGPHDARPTTSLPAR